MKKETKKFVMDFLASNILNGFEASPGRAHRSIADREIFLTIGEAINRANLSREELKKIENMLNLKINPDTPDIQYQTIMANQIASNYSSYLKIIQKHLPGKSHLFYAVALVLFLGYLKEYTIKVVEVAAENGSVVLNPNVVKNLKTFFMNTLTFEWTNWLELANMIGGWTIVLGVVNGMFDRVKKQNLLSLINMLHRMKKEDPNQLNEIRICASMPWWRRMRYCNFNWHYFWKKMRNTFRSGGLETEKWWDFDQTTMQELIKRPYEESLILQITKRLKNDPQVKARMAKQKSKTID